MTVTDTGVSTDDFVQILADMGRTVSYKVVTRTTDSMTGEETTTFAAASDQTVIFFLEQTRYIWDKEGLMQVGDAYIIAPTSIGIKRYDQFTVDSQTFYVDNPTRRHVLGTAMADWAPCFKVT